MEGRLSHGLPGCMEVYLASKSRIVVCGKGERRLLLTRRCDLGDWRDRERSEFGPVSIPNPILRTVS